MWALVEDNAIVKIINKPKAMVIGDTRHSRNIFSFRWTNEEREAIGIYEVVFDNSNKKDETYYNNTNQSFDYADGQVTASYGSAIAKSLDDVLFTAQDEIDGKGIEGELNARGLKFNHKEIIKQQASGLLAPTDWYVLKATDVESYSVPSAVTTFRTNVRTKSNEMETAIDNASDVDALKALYEYVNTGTKEEPVMERPLGEWPVLEV
tara:strand:- start:1007 stop:1630 length:624 start_codon:yes stop_codon:yes gene_type:complete